VAESLIFGQDYENTLQNFSRISAQRSHIAVFSMNNFGPTVLQYDNMSNLLNDVSSEQFLQNIAVNLMVAIGQGHSFSEGVFELPAGNLLGYRLLLISFRFKDFSSSDVRLKNTNLCLVGIFIPTSICSLLPSCALYEYDLIKYIKSKLKSVGNNCKLGELKENIYRIIQDFI
jgi:hypothetical protein